MARHASNPDAHPKKVLAVASGGGHWIELLRVTRGLKNVEIRYLTVQRNYEDDIKPARLYVVNDATRWNKIAALWQAFRVLLVMLRVRPDVVITTGAAPGYFAIRFAGWMRSKSIWLDSIANVEELSMSGQMAGRYADLSLTQWEHLASPDGAQYAGAVL
jgi:UDP-N-acetylglucosamine:LPS N-acetylglucosamine transferase